MNKQLKLKVFCTLGMLFLLFSQQSKALRADTSAIVAGTAKFTGKITHPKAAGMDSIYVNITLPHPITRENVRYRVPVNQSGQFAIDLDVETNVSIIGFGTSIDPEKYFLVKLINGGATDVSIDYDLDDQIKAIKTTPLMNQNDMTLGFGFMHKMLVYQPGRKSEPLYNKPVDYFLDFLKRGLSQRLPIVKNDSLISDQIKEILSKDFGLAFYNRYAFNYQQEMQQMYENTTKDKSLNPDIQQIDRSYFRFLRDFNLNDPEYLNCINFSEFQKSIFQNEVLDIPKIGDTDVATWLGNVKSFLSDLVGFNEGPYYDILAANAYARQLNEEIRPLSAKQKENIIRYWKNGEIAKILFRKNKQVTEMDKFKSPVVLNDVSSVLPADLVKTILSKYKNKVVFIDLWATWCGPCLNAMEQFRSAKNSYHDKDIVFVYLTNRSSPQKLWEEKIQGIGNEHYYLNDAQWAHVMTQFDFEYIPSYLLYNKEGVLIHKFSAFPGSEEVEGMIDGLL